MPEKIEIVLCPPANVERSLVDVQTRLFREHGAVSARALPPVATLGTCGAVPQAPRSFRQPTTLATIDWVLEGGVLSAGVTPGETLVSIRERAASTFEAFDATSYAPRLYLADLHGTEIRNLRDGEVKTVLGVVPPMRWASSRLCCRRVSYADGESWWSRVEVEEIWSVQLRRADGLT